jgi:hypothetical protein
MSYLRVWSRANRSRSSDHIVQSLGDSSYALASHDTRPDAEKLGELMSIENAKRCLSWRPSSQLVN